MTASSFLSSSRGQEECHRIRLKRKSSSLLQAAPRLTRRKNLVALSLIICSAFILSNNNLETLLRNTQAEAEIATEDNAVEKDQLSVDSNSTKGLGNAAIVSIQNPYSSSNQKEFPGGGGGGGGEKGGGAYLSMYGEHRVKSALASLPVWLQDYFALHRNQRKLINESEAKYLVISCVAGDRCGGFSDRMRTLPFYLFLASRVDRVICIYWSRPFGLDSFLQPLPSGIDWRCPADFGLLVDKGMESRKQAKYKHYTVSLSGVKAAEEAITDISKSTDRFYSIGFKSQDFGRVDESNMVFHAHSYTQTMPNINAWMHIPLTEHIFRAMFEPIEPIAKSINATMTRLGLVENEYTSVHVRARYPVQGLARIMGYTEADKHDKGNSEVKFEGRYREYLTSVGENALECGKLLKPDNKIFFSADSIDLTRHFIGKPIKLGKDQIEFQPIGIDSRDEIRHLENEHKIDHVEFFPLIEDLLIIGGSQCVAHGVGSFGAFGAGLAGNQCRAIHRKPSSGAPEPCPNTRGDNNVVNITDANLIFGKKASELGEGRLSPAKPQNMQDLDFASVD